MSNVSKFDPCPGCSREKAEGRVPIDAAELRRKFADLLAAAGGDRFAPSKRARDGFWNVRSHFTEALAEAAGGSRKQVNVPTADHRARL